MPREYRHIQQYEEEMLKLKAEGLTVREIGERFGLSYEKTHDFFNFCQLLFSFSVKLSLNIKSQRTD